LVPPGIEREDVLLEQALEEADHVVPVLEDQPVLRSVAGERREPEVLVESLLKRAGRALCVSRGRSEP
jgi:hypothetical protein